ncbi:uncharacterized protein AMSG_06132 [Thecamonas trahens ATCC 50062]|uniref:Glycosyltransferase 61 catalytic domain-containing protein n=1 Tax=Thecamonas trahens ATCC 50062 TaxID=461836 RepID=A0A0L0DCL1_THETB|nr:hypothetical protein AMSG_06132 [Thecamonas trahens ATCC 50062]KNC49846.1 hypothetical protein AMSG_06132 [Thecamonas trahens ATCC 50062]|eukprot:XP_013757335.1 hypothetical protein AMSG_06132 [Thecamonas trahens ATCC 50062]
MTPWEVKTQGMPLVGHWAETVDVALEAEFAKSVEAEQLEEIEAALAAGEPCDDPYALNNPPTILKNRPLCALLLPKARVPEIRDAVVAYMGSRETARSMTCKLVPAVRKLFEEAGAEARLISMEEAVANFTVGAFITGDKGPLRLVHDFVGELTVDGKIRNEAGAMLACVSEIKPVLRAAPLFLHASDRDNWCRDMKHIEHAYWCHPPLEGEYLHADGDALSFEAAFEYARAFPRSMRVWPRSNDALYVPRWIYAAALPKALAWGTDSNGILDRFWLSYYSERHDSYVELLPAARESAGRFFSAEFPFAMTSSEDMDARGASIPPRLERDENGTLLFEGMPDREVLYKFAKLFYVVDLLIEHPNAYLENVLGPHATTSIEAIFRYRFDDPWSEETNEAVRSLWARFVSRDTHLIVADVVLDVGLGPYHLKSTPPLDILRTIAASITAFTMHKFGLEVEVAPPLARSVLVDGVEPASDAAPPSAPLRVLVAQHVNGRNFINIDELIAFIQPLVDAGPPGGWVKEFAPGLLPWQDQVATWMTANMVIGFTGSHFTGVLFMPPGSVLIELMIHPIDTCMYHLSSGLGHDHWTLRAFVDVFSWANIRRDFNASAPALDRIGLILRGYASLEPLDIAYNRHPGFDYDPATGT